MDTDNPIVSRRDGLLEAEVGGEIVGLNLDNDACYGFNRTATRIWQLIETPRSLLEICAALQTEFDVAPDLCRAEVVSLLQELEREHLVSLTRGDAPTT